MKTGILTFHLAHNYGAVLQCYALQEVLRGMGHDVWVIDYQQPYMVEWFKPKRLFGIRSLMKAFATGNVREYIRKGTHPYKVARRFTSFRKKYLRLTSKCYGTDDIPQMDLYIVGSDQPWNPDLTGGADKIYYGQFQRPARSCLATYAMSGSTEAIGKAGWKEVKQYTESFDALSFREKGLTKKMSELTGRDCKTVLDPTLLADDSAWRTMINDKWTNRHYALLYHVGGPKDVIETMTEKAKAMATEEGLELIDASHYQFSPSDFVSLIRYARYVITASFHALAFSIIFKKPFVVVKTGQASDVRFVNLLDALGVTDVCLKRAEEIDIPKQVDYSIIAESLETLRTNSEYFLENITRTR